MWVYKNTQICSHDDLLPECTNFVYIIKYTYNKKYIGKKTVRSIRRKKPTKKQLAERKNYVRKELTNISFIDYEGSHNNTSLTILEKRILYQCSTKKSATYLESALLFYYNAIFDLDYLNENIGGVFYDNSLDGLLEEP